MTAGPPPHGAPCHIAVAGAGAVGCFTGGLLAAAGHRVTLLGRARVLDEIRAHGLTLSDLDGGSVRLDAPALALSEAAADLAGADLVLVCVKSPATPGLAAQIAAHLPESVPVVSLQNGVDNAGLLRSALPGRDVRRGMVAFNVVPMGQGRFHRATSGGVAIESGPGGVAALLSVPGLAVSERADMEAVQWGKLLLNLNNAINALSGLPLQQMMRDRSWRRLMADQMAEALAVLNAAKIVVAPPTPVPVRFMPHVLRLPTPLFARIAARTLVIDPRARASMAYDLLAGRATEIDSLQGRIIALGGKVGRATPIARQVMAAVRAAEANAPGLPGLSPGDLRPGGA